ncbi:MFS transporter [Pontibacter ummariensis]|uniref:Major Facilitator Superfamily protein n=1 Tax=Pontibacter ummariensis TaxID=1610492 RepID=A0A239KLW2_9BACT|nr:MFS transporter [Pontibacter ummariensis]PRY05685.1 MFS transporter [Pontibacter ummariensis]SNT18603.1 Major Facilitator Superfamily protein [Pontibacter ummariensis]
MRAYYLFLKENFKPVIFGWLLTFFSSYGQTFYISLFVPAILEQFNLSKSVFGGYYAVATVIAALFLLQFGYLVDNRPLKPLTSKVILLLLAASVGLGLASHGFMVFLALIGLRLGGQGMMSHISSSVMSRYFTADRGKALSISTMGYPMGEAFFPLFIGFLLSYWQWQNALIASSTVLLFLFLVIRQLNLQAYDVPRHKKDRPQGEKWQFFRVMVMEKAFWVLIPAVFMFSFIATGIFFFQYVLAEERGWPLDWYAMCFSGYAVVRFLCSFYGGILTDKFSASKLFPFYLLPLILGLLALAGIAGKVAALVFLLLTGITAGVSSIFQSAVIAELYGVERIGQVRSLFSMISVLSTALAPVTFGFLLDHAITLSQIALGCALVLVLASLNSLRIKSVRHLQNV